MDQEKINNLETLILGILENASPLRTLDKFKVTNLKIGESKITCILKDKYDVSFDFKLTMERIEIINAEDCEDRYIFEIDELTNILSYHKQIIEEY